jgi:hypothetical protein
MCDRGIYLSVNKTATFPHYLRSMGHQLICKKTHLVYFMETPTAKHIINKTDALNLNQHSLIGKIKGVSSFRAY